MAAVVLGRLLQGLAASWPASFRRLAWTGVGADTGRVGSIPAGGGCEGEDDGIHEDDDSKDEDMKMKDRIVSHPAQPAVQEQVPGLGYRPRLPKPKRLQR